MGRWNQEIYYYDTNMDIEAGRLAERLGTMVAEEKKRKGKRGLVLLCIGTDRSTGDSLGPLIGYKLKEMETADFTVLGTLDRPVHAMNLREYMGILERFYRDDLVVAVDASVGSREHVGYVTLGKGALKPGLGVSKELQAVGDIFITGIVGSCKNSDPLMLQSIRLSVVMNLADYISRSICLAGALRPAGNPEGAGRVENFWGAAPLI